MEFEQLKQMTARWPISCLGKLALLAVMFAVLQGSGIAGVPGADAQAGENVWKLATDDTEIVLSVKSGWPVLEALRSTGTSRNWLSSPLKESLMSKVEVDGMPKDLDWKFEGAALDAKGEQVTFHYGNASPKLSLDSVWRARPGRGPAEHWLTMTNESGRTITVLHQDSLSLTGLVTPTKETAQAWWVNRGGSNANGQGGTFTVDVDSDFDQVLVSTPNTSEGSSPVPWMAIQVAQKEGLYMGWEFSGVGRIHARTTSANPSRLDMHVGLTPDFKTDIQAGGTFFVPPALVGCYTGDVDAGSYTLHQFILEKLLPSHPQDVPYPTLAYNLYLDVGGNKAHESDVLSSAAFCKLLGFETFVPDAMWFPKDGDWRWDPARFPRGVKPIEEYTHQNNMELGLWVAWTHAGDSTHPGAMNVFRRPDWFNEVVAPDWKSQDINWSPMMDLGFDPAKDWAERELKRIVDEYKIDYLKHDNSPIVTKCIQTNHRHRYGVDVSYWSTLGYYHVMDAVKQHKPDLVLEGCSGGAHIKDFGYLKRVHYIVTTDTLASLPDRQSLYDSTFVFPPALLMAYTYESLHARWHNKEAAQPGPFLWRSAMMGAWQIDPTHSANWSPEEIESVKRATDIYKSWIRPMLKDVRVHHILPRPDDFHWDGMFYWSPSLKRGTLYIFRPNNDQTAQRIRLKGLEPETRYQVRSQDGSVPEQVFTGNELMNSGIKIKLPHKYSSDLILVEESK